MTNPSKHNKNRKQQQAKKRRVQRNAKPTKRQHTRKPKTSVSNWGSSLGARAGKYVQNTATSLFKRVTGFGDYNIGLNTNSHSPPMFGSGRNPRVSHREYLGDVSGTVAFTNTVYTINPGHTKTFPWLNFLARNFEQYRLHGMIFEFKSTSATALNSTNTAMGTVIMATNYDASDAPYTSKLQMENSQFSSSTVPSQSCLHAIETAYKQTTLTEQYVRSGPLPATADVKFYDLGLFQIATVGMQAAAVIGELWVTYEVELIKPKLVQSVVQSLAQADHYTQVAGGATSNINLYPFGSAAGVRPPTAGSNIGTTLQITFPTVSNQLFFPSAGRYLINAVWLVAPPDVITAATLSSLLALGPNVSYENFFPLNPSTINSSPGAVTYESQQAQCTVVVNVTAGLSSDMTITWQGPTATPVGPPDNFAWDLVIIKIPDLIDQRKRVITRDDFDQLLQRMAALESCEHKGSDDEEYQFGTESSILARALTRISR